MLQEQNKKSISCIKEKVRAWDLMKRYWNCAEGSRRVQGIRLTEEISCLSWVGTWKDEEKLAWNKRLLRLWSLKGTVLFSHISKCIGGLESSKEKNRVQILLVFQNKATGLLRSEQTDLTWELHYPHTLSWA